MIYGSHAEILQKRMHRGKRHHTDGKRQDAAQSLHLYLRMLRRATFRLCNNMFIFTSLYIIYLRERLIFISFSLAI